MVVLPVMKHPTYDIIITDLSFAARLSWMVQNKQRVLSMAGATDTNRSLCNGLYYSKRFL
jgi:hypothetical protein